MRLILLIFFATTVCCTVKNSTFFQATDSSRMYMRCSKSFSLQVGYGIINTAVRCSSPSSCGDCHKEDDLVILKCDKKKSLEGEFGMMKATSVTRDITYDLVEETITSSLPEMAQRKLCYTMEYLGQSIASVRNADGKSTLWGWDRIAEIGIHLVTFLEQMHADGIIHRDFHLGNVVYSRTNAARLQVIDLGDARRDESSAYRLSDLHQALVSLRYLRDGDRTFYAAKRYSLGQDIAVDSPQQYRNLVRTVYSWKRSRNVPKPAN